MKFIFVSVLAAVFVACGSSSKKSSSNGVKLELKSDKDSASYAAGLNEGERMMAMMKQNGADTILDQDLFLRGYNDYMKKNPGLGKEQSNGVLVRFFENLQKKQVEKFKTQHKTEFEAGSKFLTENQKAEGVITTPSGLQYKIIKKGSGANAKIGDRVKVHYTGTLLDGSKVDSSHDVGEPFEFNLQASGLIQGWIEALQLMNKGATYQLWIPYDLGYGEMGKAPKVPPFSVLVFELELIDVNAIESK